MNEGLLSGFLTDRNGHVVAVHDCQLYCWIFYTSIGCKWHRPIQQVDEMLARKPPFALCNQFR